MSRLYLVRHGEPAATWDTDLDPGLSPNGHEQAAAVARRLAAVGPLPVVVSPLRRTRETAAPVAAAWSIDARVESGVGEIVAPPLELAERSGWLVGVLGARWPDLPAGEQSWRAGVLDTFAGIAAAGDAVVVTHFVAINVVVGHATGDDRVTAFQPAHCSVTVVDISDGGWEVLHDAS